MTVVKANYFANANKEKENMFLVQVLHLAAIETKHEAVLRKLKPKKYKKN